MRQYMSVVQLETDIYTLYVWSPIDLVHLPYLRTPVRGERVLPDAPGGPFPIQQTNTIESLKLTTIRRCASCVHQHWLLPWCRRLGFLKEEVKVISTFFCSGLILKLMTIMSTSSGLSSTWRKGGGRLDISHLPDLKMLPFSDGFERGSMSERAYKNRYGCCCPHGPRRSLPRPSCSP